MLMGIDEKLKRKFSLKSSTEEIKRTLSEQDLSYDVLKREQIKIHKWLKEVRFRKQFVGGVNEQDVWKKIQQLSDMYESALTMERFRYEVLLEQQKNNDREFNLMENLKREQVSNE